MPDPRDNAPTSPTAQKQSLASTPVAHLPAGTQVASYTITQLIGLGGMGAVYAATQARPKRTVALKLIRPGHASERQLRRFEFEVEVLGRLQHPGIAQIYEAGIADTPHGRQPFFAMELVHGRMLTAYADILSLSTRQRLELFAAICDAVEHAHQKGVIHRDLKPSNILVTTEGQVKILDFGVARATDADLQATTQTNVGQIIGTIQYMSPEQAGGDPQELDTRADIYALGVTLYELLTERLPYDLEDKKIHDAVRIITTQDPTPLSANNRALRGDVQTIVSTALAKEKYRRYPTAAALAADIRRSLADEPILARPPSASYQLRKFARRNKPLVIGGVAVLLTLVLGLVGVSVALSQAVRARDAEREALSKAQLEADRANQVASVLRDMLAGVAPEVARGRDTTILREILDQAATRIDTDLAGKPEVEATIRTTLGNTYRMLGETPPGVDNLRKAVALFTQALGDQDVNTANAKSDLALAVRDLGRSEEAEALFREALATLESQTDPNDRNLLAVKLNLALVLIDQSRLDEAEAILRDVLDRRRAIFGPGHAETISASSALASVFMDRSQLDEAERILKEALDDARASLGDDHPNTIIVLNNLAQIYFRQGRFKEAEPILIRLVDSARRVYGPKHPTTALCLRNLGGYYSQMDDDARAQPLFQEAYDITVAAYGESHPDTAQCLNNLAGIVQHQKNYEEAEVLYRKCLEIRRAAFGDDHPDTLASMNNLAFLYKDMRRFDEAEPLYRQALAGHEKAIGPDHPTTLVIASNLAEVLRQTERFDEALALHQRTIDGFAATLPTGHWLRAQALLRHGMTLRDMRRFAEAEPELLAAHEGLVASFGDGHDRTQSAVSALVSLYEDWGAAEPAGAHDAQAAHWRSRLIEAVETP